MFSFQALAGNHFWVHRCLCPRAWLVTCRIRIEGGKRKNKRYVRFTPEHTLFRLFGLMALAYPSGALSPRAYISYQDVEGEREGKAKSMRYVQKKRFYWSRALLFPHRFRVAHPAMPMRSRARAGGCTLAMHGRGGISTVPGGTRTTVVRRRCRAFAYELRVAKTANLALGSPVVFYLRFFRICGGAWRHNF